jgi:SAM-dependent methyltransferase
MATSVTAWVRSRLARSVTLRKARAKVRYTSSALRWIAKDGTFAELPAESAVRMAFNVMLRRDPDTEGLEHFAPRLSSGEITPDDLIEEIRGSEEYIYHASFKTRLGHSIHVGRCQFIQSLPKASRILDLGGTHKGNIYGALVAMGYPYSFDELVIVDLPDELRHPIYRADRTLREVKSPSGLVRYLYHSMVDLSLFPDDSFDLVYSGQSIEHVVEADADLVFEEVHRVLRPGGYFALDTPNGRVTRLQQDNLIDPDHKIEYTFEELFAKLTRAGFTIVETKGLNYAGGSLARGGFRLEDAIGHPGLFSEIRDCYILTFLCST